jgi:hypothetical protein
VQLDPTLPDRSGFETTGTPERARKPCRPDAARRMVVNERHEEEREMVSPTTAGLELTAEQTERAPATAGRAPSLHRAVDTGGTGPPRPR